MEKRSPIFILSFYVKKFKVHRTHFNLIYGLIFICLGMIFSCTGAPSRIEKKPSQSRNEVTAKDILGNADYQAISYGGYREKSRDIQPTVEQLMEDMMILSAINIKIVRTYHTKLAHAGNVLKAIRRLKNEDPDFEMYVMLGAWIDCENAFTAKPNHDGEDEEGNAAEVQRAINMAVEYPDIVKIIAVGNEAMVTWQAGYFVRAGVILKWVNHLQRLKKTGELSEDLWITCSDNFASWGGGSDEYHTEDLTKLIKAVDYISVHTYPMHDTHYNPEFWGMRANAGSKPDFDQIDAAMIRARDYARSQYKSVTDYVAGLGVEKPIHIGETGWATASNSHYGPEGSGATDEYKEAIFYNHIRDWTNMADISCFYFEAFDEIWKDAQNAGGSENHFGLFTVEGHAKYVLWDMVDQGVFKGLRRGGNQISKTYSGDREALLSDVISITSKKKESDNWQ